MTHEEVRSEVDLSAERETFEAFYGREYIRVLRLAYSLTGRRDVAEELVQDAFVACHQRWDTVARYDSPSGWLRRVVMNRCVSAGRRTLVEGRLLIRLGRERPIEPTLSRDGSDIWGAVRRLPRRQAQVIALTYLEDRPVAEVAMILDIGEESVRTHLRRGRETLRQTLKKVEDE